MSANFSKVLVIGATSGIGEGITRRLQADGKKIIITGRRQDRLDKIQSSFTKGEPVQTLQWDILDFKAIPSTAASIVKANPDLDTVYFNAGLQNHFSLLDQSSISDDAVINEVNTNVTAGFLLARAFIPHLASLASKGQHAAFLATGSGLGFMPVGPYPVYNATKAAIHSFMVSLRMQVAAAEDQNVAKFLSICEIAPPYVATELDKNHKSAAGGTKPLSLEDFLDEVMAKLAEPDASNGKLKREIGAGSANGRVETWRNALDPVYQKIGLKE